MKKIDEFGIEKFGNLKKVLLHKPLESLKIINENNYKNYLFDTIPNIDNFIKEHENYANLLRSFDVEVYELGDYIKDNIELMHSLPNLTYMHDSSVISRRGAILSEMSFDGRKKEEIVLKEGLQNLGIPIYFEFDDSDHFEGCLLLSPYTLFIANTERHSKESIIKFIPYALELFPEIIYTEIPQERRFMHPDMIFNRVNENLALIYEPAFLYTYLITKEKKEEIDFKTFIRNKNIELIPISDDEQKNWGTSFVPIDNKTIINYDTSLKDKTVRKLKNNGVNVISIHPEALLAGGGSLRCLTLRLLRK